VAKGVWHKKPLEAGGLSEGVDRAVQGAVKYAGTHSGAWSVTASTIVGAFGTLDHEPDQLGQ
jgi:hypothetical protein